MNRRASQSWPGALNVDSRQRLDLRNLVDQLEEEGMLVRLQKGKYAEKGAARFGTGQNPYPAFR